MVSPYLSSAAKRAGILPPMTRPITETCKTDFNPAHYRVARDQREAGLEFHEWENRTPKLEPMWKSILAGFLVALAIAIVVVIT